MSKKVKIVLLAIILAVAFAGVVLYNTTVNKPTVAEGKLNVHFIDVGQADCIFVELNGKTMLIDGGNADDGEKVINYLKNQGIKTLDYVVATHAHEDHVGGLAYVVNSFEVLKAYAPVKDYSSTVYKNFVSACEKQCGLSICSTGEKWNISDATVETFWPDNGEEEDGNNSSIVLKLTYGEVSYLFMGDLEKEAESKIVNSGVDLSANVLKVGHHGSSSSTGYYFLRSVLPQVGIISCGKNNSYGHPHDETLEILKQAEVKIYRTDESGTIISSTDGKEITFTCDGESETVTATKSVSAFENSDIQIIGNKNSKKYHLSTCSSIPKEENRVYFSSVEAAEAQGYTPCSICMK